MEGTNHLEVLYREDEFEAESKAGLATDLVLGKPCSKGNSNSLMLLTELTMWILLSGSKHL